VKRQNETALQVAEFLESHPSIKKVYYPFLKNHPHYDVAKEQMSGGGGVVTFDIRGTLNDAKRLLDRLKLCYIGPSFGGVETLITHPALVSYYDYTRKERYQIGITDTLFRLAVGIEDADDIIYDLQQGLKK
jgi:cystathionine gamma-synthase